MLFKMLQKSDYLDGFFLFDRHDGDRLMLKYQGFPLVYSHYNTGLVLQKDMVVWKTKQNDFQSAKL